VSFIPAMIATAAYAAIIDRAMKLSHAIRRHPQTIFMDRLHVGRSRSTGDNLTLTRNEPFVHPF
jgi:hypothetical protein